MDTHTTPTTLPMADDQSSSKPGMRPAWLTLEDILEDERSAAATLRKLVERKRKAQGEDKQK